MRSTCDKMVKSNKIQIRDFESMKNKIGIEFETEDTFKKFDFPDLELALIQR